MMKVIAVKSFGGSKYGHISEGKVFDLPKGVDWLKAGLVVPFKEEIETAMTASPEKAVKPRAKAKRKKK